MSISFNSKLNRAGLSGSFGSKKTGSKTSGISAQAVKNLGSSSATSKTTLYSLSGRKNRNFVGGQHVTKGSNKFNYQNARASLNSRHYSPSNKYSSSVFASAYANYGTQASSSSAANFFNSLNMGMQIRQQVYSLLNNLGIINTSSSTGSSTSSGSSKLESAVESLGGSSSGSVSSSDIAGAISNMSSCNDSSSLRQAIESAKDQKSTLEKSLGEDATDKYNTAKSNVKTLEGNVKTQEKTVKEKEQAVSNANNAVDIATTKRNVAKQNLQNAMTNNTKCTNAYAQAKADTVSAKATLDSTPKKITVNGVEQDNPAYKTAQETYNNAVQAENKAKKQLQMSEDEVNEMQQQSQDAENTLTSEQKKLDEAKQQQKTANEELNTAKTDLDNAQQTLQIAQETVEKYETAQKNYEKLDSEIKKQEAELAKLEENEEKEYNQLSEEIDKKADKVADREIDASDGMSLSEKIKQEKNERAENKIEKTTQQKAELADNVAKTNILKDTTNIIYGNNGEELRTGQLPSGKTVYFIGTKEVTLEQYQNAQK